ncbi:unnamed protein product [Protopolystoma xenopodis]|uniref:Uncharacterized protein n=1 Tax=Protopolystoma xenopodis TaxID=117903 RepID=A0A448WF04_9PLAT|nr:unnamed protein product [Protopolystoma xenopodis]
MRPFIACSSNDAAYRLHTDPESGSCRSPALETKTLVASTPKATRPTDLTPETRSSPPAEERVPLGSRTAQSAREDTRELISLPFVFSEVASSTAVASSCLHLRVPAIKQARSVLLLALEKLGLPVADCDAFCLAEVTVFAGSSSPSGRRSFRYHSLIESPVRRDEQQDDETAEETSKYRTRRVNAVESKKMRKWSVQTVSERKDRAEESPILIPFLPSLWAKDATCAQERRSGKERGTWRWSGCKNAPAGLMDAAFSQTMSERGGLRSEGRVEKETGLMTEKKRLVRDEARSRWQDKIGRPNQTWETGWREEPKDMVDSEGTYEGILNSGLVIRQRVVQPETFNLASRFVHAYLTDIVFNIKLSFKV